MQSDIESIIIMSSSRLKKSKTLQKSMTFIWDTVKQYLTNSSIHGFRYLVKNYRHWSERWFWIIACILSWLGCGVLIADIINGLLTHKVDITMDTNYLNWKVDFPAIHLCFSFSGPAKDYAANITGNRGKANIMKRLSKWTTLGYVSSMTGSISSEQFITLRGHIQPNCTDIFGRCTWNDIEINCCEIFAPMQTNLGQCLSFNSIHTDQLQNSNLPQFIMNHHKQTAKLTLYLNKTKYWNTSMDFFNLLLTNVIEYPSQSTSRETFVSIQRGKATICDISLIPTHNDDGVLSVSYEERRCRFTSETDGLKFLKAYSYHGCLVETQMKRSNSLCNCVSHLYPLSKFYRTCNHTELACVLKNRQDIIDIIDDICLSDCEETIIYRHENVLVDEPDIPNWAVTKLIFNMLPSPIVRYNRYRAHSLLDVVVSIGGTVSLFIGASVLSIIELFYWLFRRGNNTNEF